MNMKKMFSTIALAMVVIIAFSAMVTVVYAATDSSSNQDDEMAEEATDQTILSYQEEVLERLSRESFFSDEERRGLLESGFGVHGNWISKYSDLYAEVSMYYFPVLDSETLYYIDSYGCLERRDNMGKGLSQYMGYAHISEDTNPYEVIESSESYTVTYNAELGVVSFWQFGQEDTYEVPAGAKYVGHSFWTGYLFRLGEDVYALGNDMVCECIAHHVDWVISCDYKYSSDAWSQPLFHLTDGRVVAYVKWSNEEEGFPDDTRFLYDLSHEGGYGKGR